MNMNAKKDRDDEELEEPVILPQIKKIANIIKKNGRLDGLMGKMQSESGKIGNLYKELQDDFHGNTKAIRFVVSLLNMKRVLSDDTVRTLIPLLFELELIPESDMVDAATLSRLQGQPEEKGSKMDAAAGEMKSKKKEVTEEEFHDVAAKKEEEPA